MAPTLVVQQPQQQQQQGRIGDVPVPHNPRNSMSISQTKGLLNGPGQNNCFLNSAVQVLWHLDIFRRSFRELSGHACMADSCIFCALKELFAQFQYSQESALPPDALRRALAETFFNQQRFQLGFMDDAAECFENILLRIHFHIANAESEDMCNALHCISHQKFAMTLVEQSVCNMCGATSEPLPFTQMVHYVSASAMCTQAKQVWQDRPTVYPEFGQLLRKAGGMGDIRECPSACGAKIQICRNLMNRPEIVSVGIVWDSERPTLEHIMNVFGTIGTTVRLQDLFHSVVDSRWASTAVHHLVGVVTYYGKHYSTFFFHTKLRVWIYFDDATVREIGPKWEQVVEKCHRGHFQPLLLLYANPHGSPISMATAPQTVTYVAGHKRPEDSGLLSQNVSPNSIHNSLPLKQNGYTTTASSIQRRSMTPNPEPGRDAMKEVCPRRAITPNPDCVRSAENQNCVAGPQVPQGMILQGGASHPQVHPNDSNYRQRSCSSSSLPSGMDGGLAATQNGSIWPGADNAQLVQSDMQLFQGQPSSTMTDSTNGNYQPVVVPHPKSSMPLTHPHGVVPNPSNGSKEADANHSIYISRKAVENVLNYQKLQRQRSMNNGNYSAIVGGNRNSNSSLESFENALKGRLQVPSSPGSDSKGSDVPDFGNIPRRRDSGNWSGDRNSASSSSSVSVENPYFYVVGNKRVYNHSSHRHPQGKSVEITANPMYDPGYDSYSLSSNDSFPLSQQAKHNQLLAQIPENPNGKHFRNGGTLDDCERLCIEADHYLEKSRDIEDTGDFLGAITLCNSAASKARAAMDAPYTNPQSIMFARMKHNTCVMRTRSLHRRFLMRQESLNSHGSTTSNDTDVGDTLLEPQMEAPQHCRQSSSDSRGRREGGNSSNNHSRQSSRDSTGRSLGGHSRQGSRDSRHSLKEGSSHSRQSSRDSQKKNSTSSIEIYATLPKKGSKKKVDKVKTGSVRVKDEQSIYQSLMTLHKPKEPLYIDSKAMPRSPEVIKDVKPVKEEKVKKKEDRKKDKGDTDFSDYASEWELTKKPSLHRTYSSPPSLREPMTPAQKVQDAPKIKAAAPPPPDTTKQPNPGKKQHKIRRKLLMGGLIRRKNRSMPDLREGQDGIDGRPENHAFDDLNLSHEEKNRERTLTGYLSDAHLDYVRSGKDQSLRNRPLYGSHRQLSASQSKIPPRPPVRTTSQLSTHHHSQSHLTQCAKIAPPTLLPHSNVNGLNYSSPYQNVPQPRVVPPTATDTQRIVVQAEVHHERTPSDNIRPVVSHPTELQAQAVLQPILRVDARPQANRCPQPLPRYAIPPELPARHISSTNKVSSPAVQPAPSTPHSQESVTESHSALPPSRLLQELQAKRQQILEKSKQEVRHKEEQNPPAMHTNSTSLAVSPQTAPTGNTWLQELQAKQIQLLHKKTHSPNSHTPSPPQNQVATAETVQTGKFTPVPNGQACMAPTQTAHPTENPATTRLPRLPSTSASPAQVESDAGVPGRSVRDLASQFESKRSTTPPTKTNSNPSVGSPSLSQETTVASPVGVNAPQAHDLRNGTSCHNGVEMATINHHSSFRSPPSSNYSGNSNGRDLMNVNNVPEQNVARLRHFEHNSMAPQFQHGGHWPIAGSTSVASHDPRHVGLRQPTHPVVNSSAPLDARYGANYHQLQNGQYQHYHQNGSTPAHYVAKEHSPQNGDSWHRTMASSQQPLQVNQLDPALQSSRMYCSKGPNGQPIIGHPNHHLDSAARGSNRTPVPQLLQPPATNFHNGVAAEGQYRIINPSMNVNYDSSKCIEASFNQHNGSVATPYIVGYNSAPMLHQHDANPQSLNSNVRTPHSTSTLERLERERGCVTNGEMTPNGVGVNNAKLEGKANGVGSGVNAAATNGKLDGKMSGVGTAANSGGNGSMKKKSKKSVTFSDQIALVASAADEDEPYMPNPLLEKVYKTVVMQQQKPEKAVSLPPYVPPVPQNRTKNSVSHTTTSTNISSPPSVNSNGGCCEQVTAPVVPIIRPVQSTPTTVPCHLCGKKSVVPPTVYCPDCEFYMSRFKPRTS